MSRPCPVFSVILIVVVMIVPPALVDAQETSTSSSSFTAEIEVTLVEIDVRVRDRKGLPISGLAVADFEVFENGQRVPINSFFEVRPVEPADPPASPSAGPVLVAESITNRLVVVVDDDSINPVRRNRALDDLARFISDDLPPRTTVTVLRMARGIDVVVDDSSDSTVIEQGLDELRRRSGGSSLAEADFRSVVRDIRESERFTEALSYARRYAEERRQQARTTIDALSSVISSMAGVSQRTILLYVSEGFPVEPGIEAFRLIQELYSTEQVMVETSQYALHDRLAALVEHANSAGVTISAYDARGLDTGMSFGVDGAVGSSALDGIALDSSRRQSRQDSLRGLSLRTGGDFSASNDLNKLLAVTRDDMTAFYSIGFHSAGSGEDARKIEVKVARPRTEVRFRSSFRERTPAQRRVDRTLAALYLPPQGNDFLISVVPGQVDAHRRGRYILPVDVIIPVAALTPIPTSEGMRVQLELLFASADVKGAASEVQRLKLSPELPSHFDAGRVPVIRYPATLELTKGRHRIAVTVSDLVSEVSSSLAGEVVVP